MPNKAKTIIFILFIPFLAAVGHDIYMNYFSTPEKIKQVERLQIDIDGYVMSDTGWIWHEYSKDTINAVRDAVPTEIWDSYINPILELPTMLVCGIPLVLAILFLVISFALGVGPFAHRGKMRKQKPDDFAVYRKAEEKRVKFNRK